MEDKLSTPLDEFKERELEIINLMAEGLSNQEIADQLFITKGTVRWYNKQIYSKLGTSRRTEAIALAREMNLIGDTVTDSTQSIQQKLPVTTGPFIGRDNELDELSNLLNSRGIRLLTIVAAGGMGKSRLSLEVGHLVKGNYEQGVAFIDLTSVRNPDDIAQFTVASLGLSISSEQTPQEILLNYCREKELLLIFDNIEHVLSGASLLSDILEIAPRVTMIVTSRERLNLRVETAYYLQPVTEDADKLFIEVASMMHPNFVLTEDEQGEVHYIVALVGGSPLALILAATWIDTLSISEVAEEIETNLDFLSADMGDMPERQHSIHAVIDPTWKRLNEKEQKAFMWASVFRGGFTRETFQQVSGASIRNIQTLLNRSLINHGHGRRYDMHPLLRHYAREKLETAGMLVDARKAHLEIFLNYAQTQANRMYDGQHYLETLEALDIEQDNFRAALDWSTKGDNIDQGIALVLANCKFWLARSRVQEAITYVEKALQLSDHPMLYYWKSTYLDRLGKVDLSTEAAHHLIAYGEANQDEEMLAYGQVRLGHMQNKIDARTLFESALSNALKTDNQHLIATCHSYLSLVDSDQFSIDGTRSHRQQALNIFESLGDLHGISRISNNIAIEYYDNERTQEAKELMDYSLQLKRKIGDRAGEARRLTTLSMWAMGEEEFEQAQEWLAESREICEELGELERLSYVLSTEGLLYLLMMDFEQAQATLERNLQMDIQLQDYRGIADISSLLAQLYLLQNKLIDAGSYLQKALDAIKHNQSQPALLIITCANYLWYKREMDACIPILATMANREINTYIGSNLIINNHLLQPLVYRIQQHIGEAAWQQAVAQAANTTIEQILQRIMEDLHIK